MVSIPMPQSVDLTLGLFREVIWAEPLLFQKGKSDCSCGVAEAGHRSLRERLSRALGRAISSLTSARCPWEGPRDGDLPLPHQGSPFSLASNGSFSPSQDPSVTQLTSAPQGGLAEFNPFSEVGEHALFLSPWVLWVVLASLG